MFWYEADEDSAAAPQPAAKAPSAEEDASALAADLKQVPRTLADARAYARSKFGQKKAEAAFKIVRDAATEYGLVIRATGHYNERVIGAEEDVRKYISRLVEKRVQSNAL